MYSLYLSNHKISLKFRSIILIICPQSNSTNSNQQTKAKKTRRSFTRQRRNLPTLNSNKRSLMIKPNQCRTNKTQLTKHRICPSLIIIDFKSTQIQLPVAIQMRRVKIFTILRKIISNSIKIDKITATEEVTKGITRVMETIIIEATKLRREFIRHPIQIVKRFRVTLKIYRTWIKQSLMEFYASYYHKLWVLIFKGILLNSCSRLLNLVSRILDKVKIAKITINAVISSNTHSQIVRFT